MSALKEKYNNEIKGELKKKFDLKNINMVPKLQKIVINSVNKGVVLNSKMANSISDDLAAITGQKPVLSRAKKSIATFKLRKGMPLGANVTLRGKLMYEFLYRLISISLPRIRDFRGVSNKGFDGNGNYNLGLKEQIIFPEINYDKIEKVMGMNITIVTSAKTDEQAKSLLEMFGMPFSKKK